MDQYYYWQRKVKDACIDLIQQPAFVEINAETIPANTHLSIVASTIQQTIKTDGNSENNSGATLKINGITLEINNNASPELIRNFIGLFTPEHI